MKKLDDKMKHFLKQRSGAATTTTLLGLLSVEATANAQGEMAGTALSLMENVQSFQLLTDGSLSVIVQSGEVLTLPAHTLSTTKLSLEFTDESGVSEDLALPAAELPDVPLHVLEALRGETLSIQGAEMVPTERSAADDAGNSAQPIDQIWEDDALTASMLHLDLADGIDALS